MRNPEFPIAVFRYCRIRPRSLLRKTEFLQVQNVCVNDPRPGVGRYRYAIVCCMGDSIRCRNTMMFLPFQFSAREDLQTLLLLLLWDLPLQDKKKQETVASKEEEGEEVICLYHLFAIIGLILIDLHDDRHAMQLTPNQARIPSIMSASRRQPRTCCSQLFSFLYYWRLLLVLHIMNQSPPASKGPVSSPL
ncbi:hypothetical protein K440DRAFT_318517 [Wilcoxina mikolae CBS 423.85]|nr:hypothetical protein K440DRAFT_318517 [Wilcoxina mikolae CBS 423.85]